MPLTKLWWQSAVETSYRVYKNFIINITHSIVLEENMDAANVCKKYHSQKIDQTTFISAGDLNSGTASSLICKQIN